MCNENDLCFPAGEIMRHAESNPIHHRSFIAPSGEMGSACQPLEITELNRIS